MSLAGAGAFFFRYRDLLVPLACALVLVPGPRLATNPAGPLLVGTLLALAGQGVRALTIGLQYIVRGGRSRRVYAEDLVTEGVYAHTRNPMYVGNMLIVAGIGLAANSWSCLVLAASLAALVYEAIVRAEERFLRSKFGHVYDTYALAVPRWTLRCRGLRATLVRGQFHWRRLLVKEYGTTAALILALCAAACVSFVRSTGAVPAGPARALVACAGVAVAFWATVRWLKKSRTLVAD